MRLISERATIVRNFGIAFARAAEDVRGDAAENAPVGVSRGLNLNAGDVQGGLRASIAVAPIEAIPFGLRTRVGSALRYALMREFGGTIVPVRARMLSWVDPISGLRRFAKRVVQRPGGPRQGYRPWLRPAGDKFPAYMDEHLRMLG